MPLLNQFEYWEMNFSEYQKVKTHKTRSWCRSKCGSVVGTSSFWVWSMILCPSSCWEIVKLINNDESDKNVTIIVWFFCFGTCFLWWLKPCLSKLVSILFSQLLKDSCYSGFLSNIPQSIFPQEFEKWCCNSRHCNFTVEAFLSILCCFWTTWQKKPLCTYLDWIHLLLFRMYIVYLVLRKTGINTKICWLTNSAFHGGNFILRGSLVEIFIYNTLIILFRMYFVCALLFVIVKIYNGICYVLCKSEVKWSLWNRMLVLSIIIKV